VLEPDGGQLAVAELATGQQAAVSGEHVVVGIDHHWDVEAEFADAGRELADLRFAVHARIARIGLELSEVTIGDVDLRVRGRRFCVRHGLAFEVTDKLS
jgi:hypothetical protein